MCGLFGVIGSGIVNNDLSIFQDLLVWSAVKGYDGTGVMIANTNTKNGSVLVHKKAYDSLWFLRTLEGTVGKRFSSALDSTANNVFIGHTRAATVGKVNDDASQPFELNSFIGTHNGTLDIEWDGYHSDSHAFFRKIEEFGAKSAVNTLKANDAYAVVMYHKRSRNILMMRNEKRPLHICINPDRAVMYYASELGMLRAAVERHNVKPAQYFYLTPNVLYEFDPKFIRNGTEKDANGKLYLPNYISVNPLVETKEPTTDV